MADEILAVTHDGTFHADEVYAAAILTLALGNVRLKRSRDPAVIATGDIVFDVGKVYDPAKGRYDHHMMGAATREDGTIYSSAGLIWRDYGMRALEAYGFAHQPIRDVQDAWRAIDETLLYQIDRVDNGHDKPSPTDLANLIDALNPSWNKEGGAVLEARAFKQALEVATNHLRSLIERCFGELEAETVVMEAAWRAEDPRVLVLDRPAPFRRTVFRNDLKEALYVVSPKGKDEWSVVTVPVEVDSYVNRKDLPAHWADLDDDALRDVTGVPDVIFAHRALFIASARSKEGALALARMALLQAPVPEL